MTLEVALVWCCGHHTTPCVIQLPKFYLADLQTATNREHPALMHQHNHSQNISFSASTQMHIWHCWRRRLIKTCFSPHSWQRLNPKKQNKLPRDPSPWCTESLAHCRPSKCSKQLQGKCAPEAGEMVWTMVCFPIL